VSHETIYKTLFIQARGALKKQLQAYLRTRRTLRRSRHHSIKNKGLGKITNAVSISERPASVKDRAMPGHWEADLIMIVHNVRNIYSKKNVVLRSLMYQHVYS